MATQSTFVLIAFWVLVQIVPLFIVWVTYRITPDQKIAANGPLGGLNMKIVGALAAWVATVAVVTNRSDTVFSFLAGADQPHLQKWTVEGQLLLLDRSGKPLPNVTNIDRNLLRVSMSPQTYSVENGKLRLTLFGTDLPNLKSFYIAYGDNNSASFAEGFTNVERLETVSTGQRLRTLQNLVSEQGGTHHLNLPYPIVLRAKDASQNSSVFGNSPYNGGAAQPPSAAANGAGGGSE